VAFFVGVVCKEKQVRICVVDGQGGGIGAALIRRLKEVFREEHEVVALGTNEVATAQMMRARANRGASGENAIVRIVPTADVILGSISIVLANAMMGEVTPRISEAIATTPAPKILLPLPRTGVEIVGLIPEPLPHMVEKAITGRLKECISNV
jgi:NAD(P)-dependent dehydrogenase (short-subunit alcohol dehydrogenase family)